MKVCAHYALSPYQHDHKRCDSMKDAVQQLISYRDRVWGVYGGEYGDDAPCVLIYPQCQLCDSTMCFHDYPMAKFQLGPRGGIQKVMV